MQQKTNFFLCIGIADLLNMVLHFCRNFPQTPGGNCESWPELVLPF